MAQDPGQHVLPERFHLWPGREPDQRRAALAINGCGLHVAEHIAHGRLSMRIEYAGSLQARQVHRLGRKAEAFDIRTSHVAAAHGGAGGPDHLDGAIIAVGAGRSQVGAAGQKRDDVIHGECPPWRRAAYRSSGPAHQCAPCRRQSRHRPVRRRSPVRKSLACGS